MELLRLPELVLHQILTLLGPLDLLQLACVSREWYHRIRNDDSLWIPHLRTYSFGIWDEIIEDVKFLGEIRISDWFVHYGRRLTVFKRGCIKSVPVGKETWIKQPNNDLAFETAILGRSFELHEDSRAGIGILARKYLYELQLFRREDPYLNFLDPIPEDVRKHLEELGQARSRDLLARRHKNLQSNYVSLRKSSLGVEHENHDRISDLFPSVNGICLEPVFACRATSIKSLTNYSACAKSASRAEKYQRWSDCHFDSFFRPSGHGGLRSFCEEMSIRCPDEVIESASHASLEPTAEPSADAFVALHRSKIRQRMNRIIHSALVPRNGPPSDICRVDLTDALELGGDNPKQEMLSTSLVSDGAVLLVMQLIGRSRF
ncbi:uncharacterized protein LOC100899875 [Galendromus occidentalis]|uniref:Uncharacterized protein LOC100899875 n=1 Tax=Galendromus occidentalis TaxID=34638 RepID=A0AAJ7SI93_9ACAR|nr:uncharacterized protein LOC100899875 [Galendromus occidentalis]